MSTQQSGVTNSGTTAYGPENMPQYSEKDWGLTKYVNNSAREILVDPEPAGRIKPIIAPAFLKPSVDDHRIGALLTIYHEIPLVREIFLNRSEVLPNYGFNPDWWSGTAIQMPSIVGEEPSQSQELLYELQRIMAFLDKTDRSYGSAEALANLGAMKTDQRKASDDKETLFFKAWKEAFADRETGQVRKLFSDAVESTDKITPFGILDLSLPAKGSVSETLYDIADNLLWPHDTPDINKCAYLSHVGEIFTFRLSDDKGPSDGIDIPAVWYPDRYTAAGKQAAFDMRMQKKNIDKELERIAKVEDTLTQVVTREKKSLKVKDLFKAALQHESAQLEPQANAQPEDSFMSDSEAQARSSSEKASRLTSGLGKLLASIDRKLLGMCSLILPYNY